MGREDVKHKYNGFQLERQGKYEMQRRIRTAASGDKMITT